MYKPKPFIIVTASLYEELRRPMLKRRWSNSYRGRRITLNDLDGGVPRYYRFFMKVQRGEFVSYLAPCNICPRRRLSISEDTATENDMRYNYWERDLNAQWKRLQRYEGCTGLGAYKQMVSKFPFRLKAHFPWGSNRRESMFIVCMEIPAGSDDVTSESDTSDTSDTSDQRIHESDFSDTSHTIDTSDTSHASDNFSSE